MVYNMLVTMFLLFVVFRLCVLLCYACKNTVFPFRFTLNLQETYTFCFVASF